MRLLITGAGGKLGGYLLREVRATGAAVTAWSGKPNAERFGTPLEPVDLADRDRVAAAFRRARPTAVIHAAAMSTVAACHRDPAGAAAVNAAGSTLLAELATEAGARLVLVSTDLVFDGSKGWYAEGDAPAPLSVYGRTKVAAERAVLAAPRSAAARVSLLFGPSLGGRPSFFDEQVDALRRRRPVPCFTDEWRTPLSLAVAARALVALAQADYQGLLHLGGPERLSRLDMARRLAAFLGLAPDVLVPARRDEAPAPEARPRDTSLECARWRSLFPGLPWPAWEVALAELMTG